MPSVLVTGASGFLGWHVANLLLQRGDSVRALVRSGSGVSELKLDVVTGDLRDAASIERAMQGCSAVFHVAADYRLWAKNPAELYRRMSMELEMSSRPQGKLELSAWFTPAR